MFVFASLIAVIRTVEMTVVADPAEIVDPIKLVKMEFVFATLIAIIKLVATMAAVGCVVLVV